MLKRILVVWFVANFLAVGVVSWLAGRWYLAWPPVASMLAELTLIMLPNFALSVLILRCLWPQPVKSLREALGWRWQGPRAVAVGVIAFVLGYGAILAISHLLGEGIPYTLPGGGGGIGPVDSLPAVFGVLALLLVMVLVTVLGEETMFRGMVQTQVGQVHGSLAGLLVGVVLFGLRHLPADIFYGRAWTATPQMWLSRQLQLYTGALFFGLARHFGRSTVASAIMHALFLIVVLFSG